MKPGKFNLFFLFFFFLFLNQLNADETKKNKIYDFPSTYDDSILTDEEKIYFDKNNTITDKDNSLNSISPIVIIKALDKISTKTVTLKINIGDEAVFENLKIKVLNCKNSEFDDNPDTIAYLQVKDITQKKNDKVFVFNGWTFSSSPSLRPFDHAVYDLWLISCHNL